MKKHVMTCAFALSSMLVGTAALSQDMTVADLKSKGGTVMSAAEVKALLSGSNLRYETVQLDTQMKLSADGSLSGTSRNRIGGGSGVSYTGSWKVTDEGRWCGESRTFGQYGGGATWCRDFFKLGDKYYSAIGNPKNDARPTNEMTISK